MWLSFFLQYAIYTRSRLPATAGSIACMCCLHMCTSSIGLGHPSTGIVAHQLRPHTKMHPLKGDTTFNTEQYIPAAIYTGNNKIQCNLLMSLHSTLVKIVLYEI